MEENQGMILVTELTGGATSVRLLKPSDMVDFFKIKDIAAGMANTTLLLGR